MAVPAAARRAFPAATPIAAPVAAMAVPARTVVPAAALAVPEAAVAVHARMVVPATALANAATIAPAAALAVPAAAAANHVATATIRHQMRRIWSEGCVGMTGGFVNVFPDACEPSDTLYSARSCVLSCQISVYSLHTRSYFSCMPGGGVKGCRGPVRTAVKVESYIRQGLIMEKSYAP